MKNIIKLTIGILVFITMFSCIEQDNTNVGQDLSIEEDKSVIQQNPPNTLATTFESAYKVVDEMPLFGGCEDKACSDEKLISYVYKNIIYPQEARDASVEGRMFVQFVIELDGSVSNIKTVRDIGAGTSEAILKVVRSFNDLDNGWSPGTRNGVKVPVMSTLPVSFKLET